jgi:hypothetical protein
MEDLIYGKAPIICENLLNQPIYNNDNQVSRQQAYVNLWFTVSTEILNLFFRYLIGDFLN